MKKWPLFLLFNFSFVQYSLCQEDAVILIIPNQESRIILDGIEKGAAKAGAAFRVTASQGEHYLEAQTSSGITKGEIVQLEAGKQKIITIEFEEQSDQRPTEAIQVANLNFNLPGTVTILAWQSNNEGKTYPYPEHYYAFEKGDEIILDVTMSNKNGTNVINVSSYPNGVVRYANKAFNSLTDLRIKIPERGIYRFAFATNHAFDRNCFLKIRRKVETQEALDFNTSVSLKRVLTPVLLHEPQDFFINGGLNATFSTGKSRVSLLVNLPPNTIEWYYRFSASRNKVDIENVKSNFKLFSELTTMALSLTGVGAMATGFAFESLVQPPGADYCEIYLLSPEYRASFEAKADDQIRYFPEGSRVNFKSGNVKVSSINSGQYFIGIKNPASTFGVNVSIEVVAITAKDEYVMGN